MGRIVVTEFVTLDGVFEDPGGAEDFEHGGWSFKFDRSEEGDRFKGDELREAEAQLLGRVTYEGFAKAWPSMGGNWFADKFNEMPKYVYSNTLETTEWNNSHILCGDFGEAMAKVKQEVKGDLLVAGSGQLVKGLIERDLVDELRLMVFPIVLGSGRRLFEGVKPTTLELVETGPAGQAMTLVYRTTASG